MYENFVMQLYMDRVLRRIFGQKRDEVIGLRKMLHSLYSKPSIIRMMNSGE